MPRQAGSCRSCRTLDAMNAIALLAGLLTYAVFAVVCGLMVLGVGFMAEPSRTIYEHAVLLGPLVPAGFLVGCIAGTRALVLASALGLIAVAVFLLLAPGPVPFFLHEQAAPWVLVAQAAYQAFLYLLVSVLAAWVGTKVCSARGGVRRPRSFASSKDVV